VTGEGVHVFDQDGFAAGGGGAANPLADGDADAGRFALERAQDEFITLI
jgi:hypothetical protein